MKTLPPASGAHAWLRRTARRFLQKPQAFTWLVLAFSTIPMASPVLAGGGCSATSYFAQLRAADTGGLGLSTGDDFQGAAQLFETPEALAINGFSFYAYIESGVPVEVTASVYLAGGDGAPFGAPLATAAVTVDNGIGDLSSMFHQADFAAAPTVEQDYVLVIENDSADVVQLIANDPSSGDGQGEGLASLRDDGVWLNGLDVTVAGSPFDADFLLQPDYRVI
ncbi:MAG: hypothetical protein AAGF23_25225, partial [Acidobacteriota bacterium]